MGIYEFIVRMTEVLIWPVSIGLFILLTYLNRGRFSTLITSLSQRLRELNVGSIKVVLAESKSVPSLTADITHRFFKRYTNGLIVQRMSFDLPRPLEARMVFPISFINEVLSFQFIGRAPLPIKEVNLGNFVLDATQCNGSLKFDLIITGM